ncbi:MAG: hypothetical protein P8X60_03255 [Robiginitalea sp.]
MRILIVLLSIVLVSGCVRNGRLNPSADLPKRLNESSGMTTLDGKTLWVIEDGGNADNLYGIDTTGSIVATFEVSNAKNKDWEALCNDTLGNLYIGDFGNNKSKRKDLVIHKLPNPHIEKGDKIPAKQIHFRYPDQESFPPPFSGRRFDAEAFFHYGDSLYIITKNQGDPFDGTAHIYSVPDQPGKYIATEILKFSTCNDRPSCRVTDAALSPDQNRLVLLGYGKLWIFENFGKKQFGKGPDRTIDLGATTQLEAICFVNDTLLYLADERRMRTGGNLYAFPLP